MLDQVRNLIVGIVMSVLAYLKPLEGELWALFMIFVVNFIFGYLAGMIAKGEDFQFKKALRCVGEAAVFFFLCTCIYAVGHFKGEDHGALQCVSFITYVVIYFYTTNVMRNLKLMFRRDTPPWQITAFIYYLLRFKFIDRIPYLNEYLNNERNEKNDCAD